MNSNTDRRQSLLNSSLRILSQCPFSICAFPRPSFEHYAHALVGGDYYVGHPADISRRSMDSLDSFRCAEAPSSFEHFRKDNIQHLLTKDTAHVVLRTQII